MEKQDLINYEKTWKTVICINPDHATVKFETNEIGDIRCPLCNFTMVTEVRPVVIIQEKDK